MEIKAVFELIPITPVALVGNTEYYTLDAALNAVKNATAADNAVVKLLDNVTGPVTIAGGDFTLDLNSYKINVPEARSSPSCIGQWLTK